MSNHPLVTLSQVEDMSAKEVKKAASKLAKGFYYLEVDGGSWNPSKKGVSLFILKDLEIHHIDLLFGKLFEIYEHIKKHNYRKIVRVIAVVESDSLPKVEVIPAFLLQSKQYKDFQDVSIVVFSKASGRGMLEKFISKGLKKFYKPGADISFSPSITEAIKLMKDKIKRKFEVTPTV